ncbi:MAG: thiamine pyrophosphate-binding protein [Desulfobacterales bacterium]|nr:thiamine pyrophosphate-binding protein [Desulfobacterales bacterium]MDP6684145.1 thiamine pyrophosphate-binding protein [Desulfobacterales bacterium]MDP6806914.1 thiamine pyrophosphate-binding protein [Desulfobacterales bacterium]
MPKLGIEFDEEAQKQLEIPLGERELYPTVGKYVAEILREQGVTVAWGVPGGHIWHFVDAISRIGIKLVIFGHEQNAVYAAEGYTQVTQKPAVAFGTVGPGTGNAFSAMQQAFLSNSPIIFLGGGIEQEHDNLYNTIQESIMAEFFEHVTKWAQRCFYPWSVKQFLTRGFRIATTAPYGPVAFELGVDCLFMKDEARAHYWGAFFPQHADYLPDWRQEDTRKPIASGADPASIEKAAKAICEAKKPFMILGDYAAWDQAGPELEEFINLTQIPFNTRRIGRAAVSEKHELHHRGFPPFRNEFDLMLPIGLKVGFFDGYAGGWPESVQIAPSNDYVWTYINTKAELVGNTKVVMKQLNECIKKNGYDQIGPERTEWAERCKKSMSEAIESRKARAYKYGPDHPRYQSKDVLHFGYCSQIIREVNEELYGSAVRVSIDGYTMSDFVMPYLCFTRPGSCITANDQAGVGHGVGQAIGASIGDLENGSRIPFLSLMGDSGMCNAAMDIHVAVQYKLPIVYMISNNGGWMPGMKYPWYGPNWDILGDQDIVGGKWLDIDITGEERSLDTRYDKLADVFAGNGPILGQVCNREEKFREQLKEAYDHAEKHGPVLMNCLMDQHLVNKAVIGPVYSLMYVHLPWDELPLRGKHSRRSTMKGFLPALDNMPEMPVFDSWEPLTEEEFGYEPKLDYFK